VTADRTARRLGSAPGQAPANKGRKYPAEPLTEAEAGALIGACSPVSRTGIRNRALLTVMYRGGLRIAESLALKPSDADPGRGTVRVLSGKGRKARTVGLDPGGMAVVQRWTEARRAAGIRGGTLFCTLAGGKLSDKYVRALLRRLAAKAGIDKRVHPHGLRHSHAAELAAEGVPVNVISRQLGHANSAVTARYLDHVAPAQVIAAMQHRTWAEPE
jgi:site-specific recombinase XerD